MEGEEISPSDVDGRKGHLDVEEIIVAHYDGREAQEEKNHYEVRTVFFTDGSYLSVSLGDPHIVDVDAANGIFEFQSLEGEPHKEVKSMDIALIVDEPAVEAREPEDKIEYIQRYILFTEEELEENRLREKEEEAKEKFLTFGPQRLKQLEEKVDSILALLENINN